MPHFQGLAASQLPWTILEVLRRPAPWPAGRAGALRWAALSFHPRTRFPGPQLGLLLERAEAAPPVMRPHNAAQVSAWESEPTQRPPAWLPKPASPLAPHPHPRPRPARPPRCLRWDSRFPPALRVLSSGPVGLSVGLGGTASCLFMKRCTEQGWSSTPAPETHCRAPVFEWL